MEYEEWDASFDLLSKTEETAALMRDVRELATMHANLGRCARTHSHCRSVLTLLAMMQCPEC